MRRWSTAAIVLASLASVSVARAADAPSDDAEPGERLRVSVDETAKPFGGADAFPLEFTATGSDVLEVAIPLNLSPPTEEDTVLITDGTPPEPAEELPEPDIDAPLGATEREIRMSWGLDDLDLELLLADRLAAQRSLEETGVRMTRSELDEYWARQALIDDAIAARDELQSYEWYGGFVFDPAAGQYVIQVVSDENTAQAIAWKHLPSERVRLESVATTADYLDSLGNAIIDGRWIDAAGLDLHIEEMRASESLGVAVRYTDRLVHVFLTDEVSSEAEAALASFVGKDGRVSRMSDPQNDICQQANCGIVYRPGQFIRPEGGGGCTLGAPFRDGWLGYVSTSGHCHAGTANSAIEQRAVDVLSRFGGGTVSRRVQYAGDAAFWKDDDALDAALHPMPRYFADNRPWRDPDPLTNSYGLNAAPENQAVRIVGGSSNAMIANTFWDYVFVGNRWVGFHRFRNAQSGDSGGPTFFNNNNRALGNHQGGMTMDLGDGRGNVRRDFFTQIQLIENRWGVTFDALTPPTQRVSNQQFNSGSGGLGNWSSLAASGGGVTMTRQTDGHLNENSLGLSCTGQPACSAYQDISLSTGTSNRIAAGAWFYCRSSGPCTVSLAVWGHGGSATPSAIARNVTIAAHGVALVKFDGFLNTGIHPLLRFQVYNHSATGRQIWMSVPRMRR